MKIRIGEIVKASHFDDNDKMQQHPFLIINISQKNIYAVQSSSVKKSDDESYFSRQGINFYEIKISNLEYVTHIRLDQFEIIKNIKNSVAMCKCKEFTKICQKLMNVDWENNHYFNKNEIINHIEKGLENYNSVWKI